eukprot:CAMPEP_0178985396 /NCGR_PEP_ID=MMETSP0795-20121207/2130_1 /TAXON_ID=88552 /ORGANISM="Amoebophrya sp., Strain Ameob2" /LENGTH=814 /DNA_ID=CAMNT_0020676351 /DNA_START=94 /DNA_END=2539 /DNA_ORIENTATION=-
MLEELEQDRSITSASPTPTSDTNRDRPRRPQNSSSTTFTNSNSNSSTALSVSLRHQLPHYFHRSGREVEIGYGIEKCGTPCGGDSPAVYLPILRASAQARRAGAPVNKIGEAQAAALLAGPAEGEVCAGLKIKSTSSSDALSLQDQLLHYFQREVPNAVVHWRLTAVYLPVLRRASARARTPEDRVGEQVCVERPVFDSFSPGIRTNQDAEHDEVDRPQLQTGKRSASLTSSSTTTDGSAAPNEDVAPAPSANSTECESSTPASSKTATTRTVGNDDAVTCVTGEAVREASTRDNLPEQADAEERAEASACFLHLLRAGYSYAEERNFVHLRGCGSCDRRHVRVAQLGEWARKHLRGKQISRRFGSANWKSFSCELLSPHNHAQASDAATTAFPVFREESNYELYARHWQAKNGTPEDFENWQKKVARSPVIGEISPATAARLTEKLQLAAQEKGLKCEAGGTGPPIQAATQKKNKSRGKQAAEPSNAADLQNRKEQQNAAATSDGIGSTSSSSTLFSPDSRSSKESIAAAGAGRGQSQSQSEPRPGVIEAKTPLRPGPPPGSSTTNASSAASSHDPPIGRGFLVLRKDSALVYAVVVLDFLGADDIHVAWFWFDPQLCGPESSCLSRGVSRNAPSRGVTEEVVQTGTGEAAANANDAKEHGLFLLDDVAQSKKLHSTCPAGPGSVLPPRPPLPAAVGRANSGASRAPSVVNVMFYKIFESAHLWGCKRVWMGPIDPGNPRYQYKFQRLKNCAEILCRDDKWLGLHECSEIDARGRAVWTYSLLGGEKEEKNQQEERGYSEAEIQAQCSRSPGS